VGPHELPWLGDLLVERDEAGRRRWPVETCEDFLAALLLSSGAEDPSPALAGLLARFAARAGLPPDADRATAEAAVAAYFAERPLPADLTAAFRRRYRAYLATPDGDEAAAIARAAERLEGTPPLARAKAPPAPGPKGPLAYFAAHRGTRPRDELGPDLTHSAPSSKVPLGSRRGKRLPCLHEVHHGSPSPGMPESASGAEGAASKGPKPSRPS
jgi:hypothetical protein